MAKDGFNFWLNKMNRLTDYRPNSETQFKEAIENGLKLWKNCLNCEKEFSNENTKTPAGWRETQISGFCECCFDKIFGE